MSDWVGYIMLAAIAAVSVFLVWLFIVVLCIVGDMWGVV